MELYGKHFWCMEVNTGCQSYKKIEKRLLIWDGKIFFPGSKTFGQPAQYNKLVEIRQQIQVSDQPIRLLCNKTCSAVVFVYSTSF